VLVPRLFRADAQTLCAVRNGQQEGGQGAGLTQDGETAGNPQYVAFFSYWVGGLPMIFLAEAEDRPMWVPPEDPTAVRM